MADRDRFGGSDSDYAYTDYSGRQGLDVRNPGDYAIQQAYSYPSNRQPLLNQPPMEGPPQRPHVNPRMRHINPRGMGGGLGGLQEQAAVDPSDWRILQQIIKAGENPDDYIQTAGGYGYNPPKKSYSDIYKGTDVIDMEVLPGAGYGPDDEYDFDYKRNRFEDLFEGKWPSYVARGGLMSLRR